VVSEEDGASDASGAASGSSACAEDINFRFTGFALSGRVVGASSPSCPAPSSNAGPSGVSLTLTRASDGARIAETKSVAGQWHPHPHPHPALTAGRTTSCHGMTDGAMCDVCWDVRGCGKCRRRVQFHECVPRLVCGDGLSLGVEHHSRLSVRHYGYGQARRCAVCGVRCCSSSTHVIGGWVGLGEGWGNAELKDWFSMPGYDVRGRVLSSGEGVRGVDVFLFASSPAPASGACSPALSGAADRAQPPAPSATHTHVWCVAQSANDGEWVLRDVPCGSYLLVPPATCTHPHSLASD
jgi:hypothetical protein